MINKEGELILVGCMAEENNTGAMKLQELE
jgi:hypothetical protein